MYTQEKTQRHTARKKHIHVKHQSSQNNEESSVEVAPLAMTTKEATHMPSHHDKMATIVKTRDWKHHDIQTTWHV